MPCVGLDWFVPFLFASNRTGPVHFQTCIGLNRIDPEAALLYYVPDCTGLYRFFLCTGLYRLYYVPDCTGLYGFFLCTGLHRLYYVPVCTGLYRMYRYITGPLGPGARAPWTRGPGTLAQGVHYEPAS